MFISHPDMHVSLYSGEINQGSTQKYIAFEPFEGYILVRVAGTCERSYTRALYAYFSLC